MATERGKVGCWAPEPSQTSWGSAVEREHSCTHTHTHAYTFWPCGALFQVSEEQRKHLGETWRPECGAYPGIGPGYSDQTRPSTHGDTQRRKRRPAPSFCPPSCSSRIRPGLPSVGGPVQRTWLLTPPTEPSQVLTQPGSPRAGAPWKGHTHEVEW